MATRAKGAPPAVEFDFSDALNNPTLAGNPSLKIKYNPILSDQQLGGLRSAVTDLVGMQGELLKYKATEEAQAAAVKGAEGEIAAYETVAGISEEAARLTLEAGKIEQFQEERAMMRSLGKTRADVAGAGFAASGSALDLLESSVRQGYLQQQITGTQTAITSAAYLEQAAASRAQKGAAEAQRDAALAYGAAATEAIGTTQTNIDAETRALLGYTQLLSREIGNTAESELMFAPLQGLETGGETVEQINKILRPNPLGVESTSRMFSGRSSSIL